VKASFEEAVIQLREIGIEPSGPIMNLSINTRARKRLGCCKKEGRGYSIEISELCSGLDDKALKEIIIHELLHTCRNSMNHGPAWKYNAERVRRELGYRISSTANYEKLGLDEKVKSNFRYKITCINCGSEMYRIKKSRVVAHPEAYRCSRCGGILEVTRL
jgi:predicted SprT family Zn-dependent metalloprotease